MILVPKVGLLKETFHRMFSIFQWYFYKKFHIPKIFLQEFPYSNDIFPYSNDMFHIPYSTTMHTHRFSTHPPFHLFLIHNWRQLVAGVCGWQSYALCLVALDLRTHSLPPILLGGYSGWESRKGGTWAKIGHVATQFPPTHHLLSWHCYINNQACFFQQCTRTVSQPTHPSISF